MFRLAMVALLVTILPNFAPAQEVGPGQTPRHEIVKGETLWHLAGRYLGNPFRWPLLYEANSTQIENPDLIYPGQILVIPRIGAEMAQVQGVTVISQVEVAGGGEEQVGAAAGMWIQASGTERVVCPGPGDRTVFFSGRGQTRSCQVTPPTAGQRTSFYPVPGAGTVAGGPADVAAEGGAASAWAFHSVAVPMGLVYATDWLVDPGEKVGFIGTLGGYSTTLADRLPRGAARVGDRLHILPNEGIRLAVGDLLQSFRSVREDEELGTVLRPTGILVVTAVTDSTTIATVSSEFQWIEKGERVRLAPDYAPLPDVFPIEVESNVTATVLGFPEDRQMQALGAAAFLDVGVEEGISIGDIFRADVTNPGPYFGTEAARLQVVLVEGNRSTARIISVRDPVLASGNRVILVKKMQ
jgi:LysM repeat protein